MDSNKPDREKQLYFVFVEGMKFKLHLSDFTDLLQKNCLAFIN